MSQFIEEAKYTCALGAQQTVLGIPRAVPIIHAGPGCSERQFMYLTAAAGYQGEEYAGGGHVPCTNTSQNEVVFGGEKKLATLIDATTKVIDGDLFVVLAGCTAGIVGDDVGQVARDHSTKEHPVIGVDTAGFRGNNYKGHDLVINGIIEQYVGDVQPKVRKGLVNVFSVIPNQNVFWRGDLEEIKSLLNGIGLEVNILFGYGCAGVSEWKDIPNAELNIVLSPWVGLQAAQLCEKKFGTPYLHCPVLPTGLKDTSKFLRTVSEKLNLDTEKTEQFIAAEEKRYKKYFVSLGDLFADYASYLPYDLYLANDSVYGVGAASFLTGELGMIPRAFYDLDNPDNNALALIEKTLVDINSEWEGRIIAENDNAVVKKKILEDKKERSTNALILGSSWDKQLAVDTESILVRNAMPITDLVITNKTYVGYNGGLALLADIYSGLFNKGMISKTTNAE